ncbi:MAG: uridine diphosphate-N-acetylglucosamine-binding protein YvcK [Chloroflexota bacterium]
MGIKRWALLILAGSVLTGVGIAMVLVFAYRNFPVPGALDGVVRVVTLQRFPIELRLALVLPLGLLVLGAGLWQLSRALVSPFVKQGEASGDLARIYSRHRGLPSGETPAVVAVGGGTGLSSLLRGLKKHDLDLTAIVTVADDGGSTGRLRSEFDIPAPGDIRNCLAALADDESLVSRLFQYRFDQAGSQFDGHSFGNIFITALTQVTGSFERAVTGSASVLNIRGRVLPSTLENVHLAAELEDGTTIRGESTVGHHHGRIDRILLEPASPKVYEPAFGAILNADLIVLGPGSLYTSIAPNLLIEGISQAIRWSPARIVYVCNVATQPGETDGLDAADHVRVIEELLGAGVLDDVVVNDNPASGLAIGPGAPIDPILPDSLRATPHAYRIVERDVVSDRNPLRHDPDKLSGVLLELLREPRLAAAPAGEAATRSLAAARR